MISTQNSPIRGVLFDLDDTLYNRGTAFHAWATDIAVAALPTADSGERADAAAFLIAADGHGYAPRPAFVDRVYQRFPQLSGQSADDFVGAFRAAMLTKIRIEKGAVALIETLNARGIPWGIVTNGSTVPQQRKVDRLGLSKIAACVVISETFGEKKPLPAIFHHAAGELGIAPSSVLFVGDHIVNDIGGARQTGMRTAWLRRGRDWPDADSNAPPDLAIDDLAELIGIFGLATRC